MKEVSHAEAEGKRGGGCDRQLQMMNANVDGFRIGLMQLCSSYPVAEQDTEDNDRRSKRGQWHEEMGPPTSEENPPLALLVGNLDTACSVLRWTGHGLFLPPSHLAMAFPRRERGWMTHEFRNRMKGINW